MEQEKYAQQENNFRKKRMQNNQRLYKNKQTSNLKRNTGYGKHIAAGGIVQLYFIQHFI